MNSIQIISNLEQIGCVDISPSDEEIKNEPMLFNCSLQSAFKLGGPITVNVLDDLCKNFNFDYKENINYVVDSRVHMLMPNWYPCVPGWHHDDVTRNTSNGQPNYITPDYRSLHYMLIINSNLSPTEFALGTVNLNIPVDNVYQTWHKDVELLIANNKLESYFVKNKHWYKFDDRAFHRGTPANDFGWRYFIRVSKTERKPTNEIRKQVQVYMSNLNEGW